jgi:hypothetical protein
VMSSAVFLKLVSFLRRLSWQSIARCHPGSQRERR